MKYYSGKLIIHNETKEYDIDKYVSGHIVTMKFSVNFNNKRMYLSKSFLEQLLESKAVQKYIMNEVSDYISSNKEMIERAITKTLTIGTGPTVEVKVIGQFFYIKVYCSRNHKIEDCINAVNRKIKNQKTQEEILRGE